MSSGKALPVTPIIFPEYNNNNNNTQLIVNVDMKTLKIKFGSHDIGSLWTVYVIHYIV